MTDMEARLLSPGVIPVVVIDDAAQAAALGRGLLAGGLPVAEVTLRTPAALAAIAALAGDELLVGAGTVLSVGQLDEAHAAGARFAVSPGFSAAIGARCRDLGIPYLPGAVTATEIMTALAAGFDLVKFFPAGTSGGPAAIRALAAPFGGVRFVPTGGVSAANLPDYLGIPSVPAVGGSWLTPRDALQRGDAGAIAGLASEAVAAAASARSAR